MVTPNSIGVDRIFDYALVAAIIGALVALWAPTPYWTKRLVSVGLIANAVEALRR